MGSIMGTTQNKKSELDQQVMDMIVDENRTLKQALEKVASESEDLREQLETVRIVEQETMEENEVLKYEVASLQAEASINDKDMSHLSIVNQLESQNKQLSRELASTKREMNRVLSSSEEDCLPVSEQDLTDLKALYERNKIVFDKSDQMKVLAAIYIQDRPVVRLYRELFYQQMAKQALDQAEFLFKQTASVRGKNVEECGTKLFVENRRFAQENKRLTKSLAETNQDLEQEREQKQYESNQHQIQLEAVQGQASLLELQAAELREQLDTMREEFQDQLEQCEAGMTPQYTLLIEKLNKLQTHTEKEVEELCENMEQQMEELEQKLKQSEQKVSQTEEKLSQSEAQNIRQAQHLEGKNQEIKTVMGLLEDEKNKLSISIKNNEESTFEVDTLTEQLKQQHSENKKLNDKVKNLEDVVLGDMEEKFEELKAEFDESQMLVEHLGGQNTQLHNDQSNNLQKIELMTNQLNTVEEQYASSMREMEDNLTQIRQSHANLSADSSQDGHQIGNLKAEIRDKQKVINEMTQRFKEYEKMIEERNEEINELMNEVNKFQEERPPTHETQFLPPSASTPEQDQMQQVLYEFNLEQQHPVIIDGDDPLAQTTKFNQKLLHNESAVLDPTNQFYDNNQDQILAFLNPQLENSQSQENTLVSYSSQAGLNNFQHPGDDDEDDEDLQQYSQEGGLESSVEDQRMTQIAMNMSYRNDQDTNQSIDNPFENSNARQEVEIVQGIYGEVERLNQSEVSENSRKLDDTSKEIMVSELEDFEAEALQESADYGKNMEEGEGGWESDQLEEIKENEEKDDSEDSLTKIEHEKDDELGQVKKAQPQFKLALENVISIQNKKLPGSVRNVQPLNLDEDEQTSYISPSQGIDSSRFNQSPQHPDTPRLTDPVSAAINAEQFMPLAYFECTQENTVDESADFGQKEVEPEEVQEASVEQESEAEVKKEQEEIPVEQNEDSESEEMQDRKKGGAFMGTFEGNDGHNVVQSKYVKTRVVQEQLQQSGFFPEQKEEQANTDVSAPLQKRIEKAAEKEKKRKEEVAHDNQLLGIMDDSQTSRYSEMNESSVINQSIREQHMSFAGQPGHTKGGLSIDMDNDLQLMNDSGICGNINDYSRGSFENHVRNLSIGYDQMGNGRGNIGSFVGSMIENPIQEEDGEYTNSPDSPEIKGKYQSMSPTKLDDDNSFGELELRATDIIDEASEDEAEGLPQIEYFQDSQRMTEGEVLSQVNDSAQIIEGEANWSEGGSNQLPEVAEVPEKTQEEEKDENGGGWDTQDFNDDDLLKDSQDQVDLPELDDKEWEDKAPVKNESDRMEEVEQKEEANKLFFNELHQMCEEHVPNVLALFTKVEDLSLPETDQQADSFVEWKQFGSVWYQGELNGDGQWHGRGLAIIPQECLQISIFNQGKMNGPALIFDNNEKVRRIATYQMGELQEQVKQIHEDGREELQFFENGVQKIDDQIEIKETQEQEQIDIDLSSEDNDPVPAEKETDKMDIDLSSDEGNGPLPVEKEAEKLDIDLSSDEDFMAKPEPANPVDDLFAKPDVDNSIVDDLFAKPMDSNPVEDLFAKPEDTSLVEDLFAKPQAVNQVDDFFAGFSQPAKKTEDLFSGITAPQQSDDLDFLSLSQVKEQSALDALLQPEEREEEKTTVNPDVGGWADSDGELDL